MATHVYVINPGATSLGDLCSVTGTVDGFPVSFQVSLAAISALPNPAAVQAYLIPWMLKIAIANGSIAPPAVTLVASVPAIISAAGTFTQ